ncbi:MAG: cytochrome c biogenesis heme-transporting ATPase CcmA [Pseudomonadota bacterium]
MKDRLLSIEDLRCERDGRQLFTGLNLSVEAGECVALLGPNGSGKSTLLRCVTGFFPDYEGTIQVAELAYLGHRPGIAAGLSALENLRWYAGLAGVDGGNLSALLERVGLAGYDHILAGRLSAGQQRRVALARLMLDRAPLWLLDEPFTALDTDGVDLVRALLVAHLNGGGAALCATHQALEVAGSSVLDLGAGR